jgi:hypothetical protein
MVDAELAPVVGLKATLWLTTAGVASAIHGSVRVVSEP